MTPTPAPLALLISLIGFGVSANEHGGAEEAADSGSPSAGVPLPPLSQAGAEWVLGLRDAGEQAPASDTTTSTEAVEPDTMKRAQWALGLVESQIERSPRVLQVPASAPLVLADEEPEAQVLPPDFITGVVDVLAAPTPTPQLPDPPANAPELIAKPLRDPDAPEQPGEHAAWVPDIAPHPDDLRDASTERPAAASADDRPRTSPPVAIGSPTESDPPPPAPQRDAAPVAQAQPGPAATESLFARIGRFVRSIFGSAQPRRAPAAMHFVHGTSAGGTAPREVAFVQPEPARERTGQPAEARKIILATHSEKVLMSLAALQAGDDPATGRHGAETREIVVTSNVDKVLANLADVRGDIEARHAREKSPSVPHPEVSADRPEPAAANAEPVAKAPDIAPVAREPVALVASARPLGDAVPVMEASKLDRVRGGFVAPNGLQVSFGIQRAVYINGNLVTTTSLNVSSLGGVSPGTAGAPASSTLALIQSGAGNTFTPGVAGSPSSFATVIQNTLNGQKIQNLTVVDVTVNSLQMLRAINLQSSLRSAITDSLRR